MPEHSPEPWKVTRNYGSETACPPTVDSMFVKDANGIAIIAQFYTLKKNLDACEVDMNRVVACVNFCQHLPIDIIEKLTAAKIGPATLAQWVRANPEYVCRDDGVSVCAHCDHILPSHEENCLLEKALNILKEWKP